MDSSRENKRTRLVKFDGDDSDDDAQHKSENNKISDSPGGKSSPFIPFMPNFLFNTLDSAAKSKFTKWRNMVNQGGGIDKKDLVTPKGVDKDTDTPPKKSGNNKTKKTCLVTIHAELGSKIIL